MVFPKKNFSERESEALVLCDFNIIINHIFPANFIEIPKIVQKIRKFSNSILTIFINFSVF